MNEDTVQGYQLTAPEDIYGALRKIVNMASPVQIHINGSEQSYSSSMTGTELKQRSFFIDSLIPEDGNRRIHDGGPVHIRCDSQGVLIEFEVTGRIKYNTETEQYRIEFPREMLYLQRRTAYRVTIPPAHDIRVDITLPDTGEGLTGIMEDTSSSGFRACFKGDVRQRLSDNRNIAIAHIHFNQEHHMDCSLETRHIVLDEQGNTHCGFACTSISPAAQRYLDKLIAELQWEERRLKEQSSMTEKD